MDKQMREYVKSISDMFDRPVIVQLNVRSDKNGMSIWVWVHDAAGDRNILTCSLSNLTFAQAFDDIKKGAEIISKRQDEKLTIQTKGE